MKRLLCGAAVAAALLISATPSSAQVYNMTATLTGAEETTATPGVLGLLTGAVGTATVSVDATNEEVAVQLELSNFATGTTAGHIHVGPRGVAGPVVLNFPIPTGRTGDLPTQSYRLGRAAFVARPEIGINTIQDLFQAIIGGGAYVNIHTSQFPAGEIRGQLVPVPVR
jgi:CHRD domain-containing protein